MFSLKLDPLPQSQRQSYEGANDRLLLGPQIVGPSTHDEIDEFLKEWKPSLQKEAPTGWIWCHLAQAANEEVEKPAEDSDEKHEKFEEEGQKLVEALIARCKEIKVCYLSIRRSIRRNADKYAGRIGDRTNSCEERRKVSKSS